MEGCTDPTAFNYNPDAIEDDGSCLYAGCTDETAINFDPDADEDDLQKHIDSFLEELLIQEEE